MRSFLAIFATVAALKALPAEVCEIVKDQGMEKAGVELVCQKQSKVPQDECAAALSQIWEAVATKVCPAQANKVTGLPDAGCKILEDKDTEKQAVKAICDKQTKVPKIECTVGLSTIWESVMKKECPKKEDPLKEKLSALKEKFSAKKEKFVAMKEKFAAKKEEKFSALPEVACDILKDSDKEKAAVEMACEKQSKVPADECAAGLSKIWEMITAKECPKTLKEKFAAKKEKFVGKFFALKEKFVGKFSALKEKFSAKKEKKEVQTMFV